MKKLKLELIIIILSLIIFISLFEEVHVHKNQDLSDKIVEYSSPEVEQSINGSTVYVTGSIMDDSQENFDDVLLNVSGIGSQGQTIASKTIHINRINSYSTVAYNVSLENNSPVVAGNINVINATKIS